MPYATVTLKSTTFSTECDHNDPMIQVSSTANITPGQLLYADRELMTVVRLGIASGVNNGVFVRRGVQGTNSHRHVAGQITYIGQPHQFYLYDPLGEPPIVVPVLPHINAKTGDIWTVFGDDGPPNSANRWWSLFNTYQNVGSLGVRSESTGSVPPVGQGTVSQTQD